MPWRRATISSIPARRIQRFTLPGDAYRDADAILVLDTGTWNQLGDFGTFLRPLPVAKVVIDHHLTQDDLGAIRLVDTTAEATGRLVCEAIAALGATSRPAGGARPVRGPGDGYRLVPPQQHHARHVRLAADLVRAGARPTEAYEALFEQSTLGRLKLTGLVLGRLHGDA